ncbi:MULTISPECIES: hypothetical protein [unclassified Microbacterium]|uniref:hypothetical protein n=1 Tax=unclassified Microbacterium TaxID=2609290 RepID=UPI0010F4C882|nr:MULTISPECIES: hypothetical protein [unclassified Microbacterium]
MEYNPFTAQVREQTTFIGTLRAEAAERREHLDWYDSFDPQSALQHAVNEVERISRERAELQETLDDARARMQRARPLTWFRLYPPALLVKHVRDSGKEFHTSKAIFTTSSARMPELEAEDARAIEAVANQRAEGERHASFDRQAVVERLSALEADIEARTPGLEILNDREERLQEKLAEPLKALTNAQAELRELRQKADLARSYLNDLENAPDSRARAKIHRNSETDLGDDKPSRFIGQTRGRIVQLERQVRKLEERVRGIVRQGTLDVQTLILDGSNLCHSGAEKIGLFAIRALTPYLLEGREVQVVFDASVVRLLSLSVERLESELSDLQVHVVDDKATADKIILRLASEPGSYVLSNDRFADYPDMPAVVAGRIITVEIIGGRRAIIDDLDIDVSFSRTR